MTDLIRPIENDQADLRSKELNLRGLNGDAFHDTKPSESNWEGWSHDSKFSTKGRKPPSLNLKISNSMKKKGITSYPSDLSEPDYLKNVATFKLTPSGSEESSNTDRQSSFDDSENKVRYRPKNGRNCVCKGRYKPASTDSSISEETDGSLTKSQKADILCEQLRLELMENFNDQIKKTVEHAVDRILERAEIGPSVVERNLIKAK
ncbi:unnamed protein product [Rodentolepis nana]|uniref:VASP_tetra domain-containing protein n=1 Tax=Rodentolepis nana TaxID=102285 RepID=A0A0R3TBM6_RODNA|nr:unnamed protein product [Rodentolepis nana]